MVLCGAGIEQTRFELVHGRCYLSGPGKMVSKSLLRGWGGSSHSKVGLSEGSPDTHHVWFSTSPHKSPLWICSPKCCVISLSNPGAIRTEFSGAVEGMKAWCGEKGVPEVLRLLSRLVRR